MTLPRVSIPTISGDNTGVIGSRHQCWNDHIQDWYKWRLAFEGGQDFIDTYVYKLSAQESASDLSDRKAMTYCPSFAAAAIKDITNAIFQRTADVVREGGASSYQKAIEGTSGGVDFEGNSMGSFIGTKIIDELLVLGKVGVLTDNFSDLGTTIADKGEKHPFISYYTAENILSWYPNNPIKGYDALLLREVVNDVDSSGLPNGTKEIFRLMRRTQDGVSVQFFTDKGVKTSETLLALDQIPFTLFDIGRSLMRDVADYQIALMNIESSDIAFARKANFPIYYEFYDPVTDPPYAKPFSEPGVEGDFSSHDKQVKVGIVDGRRIPQDGKPPGFINPDPATLKVSMEKGNQIKRDIRALVNLNLATISEKQQSAESKDVDNRSLEASLSFIALVLQKGEQKIAEDWLAFEGSSLEVKVTYPKTYSLKSEKDRRDEASELDKLGNSVPSNTFRREIKKKVARTLIGGEVIEKILEKIEAEIDAAEVVTSDPNIILSAHKAGLIDDVSASASVVGSQNPEKMIESAREDRADRIAETLKAQGGPENADGNRGAPEFDKGTTEDEKEGKKKRGKQDNSDVGSEQK